MPISTVRIAQLEKELEEARTQLLKEDGERYRVLMREISQEEKERILGNLMDKRERTLFGLDAAEERRGGAGMRPGTSGGEMVCQFCGKRGLTKRGLALHIVRLHKEEAEKEEEEVA